MKAQKSHGPGRRGPRAVGDVLGELFAARGLGRMRDVGDLEAAWANAIGEPGARQTQVLNLRHGVLTVAVAHPVLLEELAAFRKPKLLESLRNALPGLRLHDLRFRVGPVGSTTTPGDTG